MVSEKKFVNCEMAKSKVLTNDGDQLIGERIYVQYREYAPLSGSIKIEKRYEVTLKKNVTGTIMAPFRKVKNS